MSRNRIIEELKATGSGAVVLIPGMLYDGTSPPDKSIIEKLRLSFEAQGTNCYEAETTETTDDGYDQRLISHQVGGVIEGLSSTNDHERLTVISHSVGAIAAAELSKLVSNEFQSCRILMLSPVSTPKDILVSRLIQIRLSSMMGDPVIANVKGNQTTTYIGDSDKAFTVSNNAWDDLDNHSFKYATFIRSRSSSIYAVAGSEDRVFLPEDTKKLFNVSYALELQDTHSLKQLESVNIIKRLVGLK